MRKGGTLSYLLSDHLGSTSITTNSAGALGSELRYKPWGETRYSNGTTPTKYTYTGQYSNVSDFGLMFYNARWYDPSIGRFAQADSIVPGGVQGYDRYAYVKNNPLRYTDPTGHKDCEEDGYCPENNKMTLPVDRNKQHNQQTYFLPSPPPIEEIMKGLPVERPVSGVHLGVSGQTGLLKDTGIYAQYDPIMDWKKGTLYHTITVGAFEAGGTPNGVNVEIHAGTTQVHGIPLFGEEDLTEYLDGRNIDAAVSVGGDAIGKLAALRG